MLAIKLVDSAKGDTEMMQVEGQLDVTCPAQSSNSSPPTSSGMKKKKKKKKNKKK